ncbi:DUF6890 family protein [Actinobacillus lignieresii]
MHYLPFADNSETNLARALWLHKNYFDNLANATTNGISQALGS